MFPETYMVHFCAYFYLFLMGSLTLISSICMIQVTMVNNEFFINIVNINLKHEYLVTEMLTLLWRFSCS